MLPKDITEIIDLYEEDDYDFYFSSADINADDLALELNLTIREYDKPDSYRKWKVIAKGDLEHKLYFDKTSAIRITDDHPLLWEFTDNQCQLYFVGKIESPEKVFYDLLQIHLNCFKNFRPFGLNFGDSKDFSNRFQYSTGLLTSGPKNLLLKYGECLRKNGLNFNFLGESKAKKWTGQNWISFDYKPKVFLLGESFIVAKEFKFMRH